MIEIPRTPPQVNGSMGISSFKLTMLGEINSLSTQVRHQYPWQRDQITEGKRRKMTFGRSEVRGPLARLGSSHGSGGPSDLLPLGGEACAEASQLIQPPGGVTAPGLFRGPPQVPAVVHMSTRLEQVVLLLQGVGGPFWRCSSILLLMWMQGPWNAGVCS